MVQRVESASVSVDSTVVGAVGAGLCLLVGVEEGDDATDARAAVDKISNLRVFPDSEGKMNLSLIETAGSLLVVSQFTLLGEIRRGRRPSFTRSAEPLAAEALIDEMVVMFIEAGIDTATGVFGAHMKVDIRNDGPVTLVVDVNRGKVL